MFAQKLKSDAAASEIPLLYAYFNDAPEPLLLCDASLVILSANKSAENLLRIPAGEVAGRNAREVLPLGPPGDGIRAPQQPAIEWRSTCERDGRRCDIEVSGKALRGASAGAEGWLLVLQPLGLRQAPPEFIGHSPVTQELLEFVSRIARSRAASIMLLGESGTGKELIARRLHALSPRADAPFIAVNCAALPESLFESELFGYEKGAFTNAAQRKEGLLALAHGGTVFFDEIGDLPLALQTKMLRVLEERSFRRVGGSRNIPVDLRIISATNTDLENAIQARRFRSDLYYRLNGVLIGLPALRERAEDIHPLAIHFLQHFNRVHHRHIRGIHPSARRLLNLYSWPGNVRELRNVIERALLVETSSWITPSSLALPNQPDRKALPPAAPETGLAGASFCLRSSERELIAAALAESGGNQSRAARLLGIGRFSLRYKMKALGML